MGLEAICLDTDVLIAYLKGRGPGSFSGGPGSPGVCLSYNSYYRL